MRSSALANSIRSPGGSTSTLTTLTIYPAKQFVTPYDKLQRAVRAIREELDERVTELERENKLIEAQTRQTAHGV